MLQIDGLMFDITQAGGFGGDAQKPLNIVRLAAKDCCQALIMV